MRYFNELRETTNTQVFKRIYINKVTGCCLRCAKRHRRSFYYKVQNKEISNSPFKQSKFPSWKLVSKNKKQWMYKHLIRFKKLSYSHVEEIYWQVNN